MSASAWMYVGGHVGVDARVHPHGADGQARLPRKLGDGLVQHLHVELEAERCDVAGLLGAEQVARAPDLEVAHRDLEPGAELGVVGERREPRAGLRRELARVGVEEVRVGGHVRAADAPSDLVQLREAERVGPLDDQRVGLGDVDPRLDDRRRHEDVRVAGEERVHPLLELALRHLAVCDEEPQAGAQLPELLRGLVDRLDAVVQVEGLPFARMLALERQPDRAPRRTPPPSCGSGRRPSGGVSMIEMSRSPESDMWSVRGIGVAERESTSTSRRSARRSSFCWTPNRCSSSTITRPSCLGITSRERMRCVPTSTSTFPSANSRRTALISAGFRKRETISTRTGKSR